MEWWEALNDRLTEDEAWRMLREWHPAGGVVRILGPCPREGTRAKVFVLNVPAMTYNEYLNSSTWRNIRVDALRGAEGKCQVCNSPDDLEVHHRRYPTLGTEQWPNDLTVLCSLCHSMYEEVNRAIGRRVRRRLSENGAG